MTTNRDIDQEIRQRFAMLHLAWDEAYGTRKRNPETELRKYLHILSGIEAIWSGIGKSKQYYRTSPTYKLDSGLSVGICRCICDILINTHPNLRIPESLSGELTHVTLELLERHITSDFDPDPVIIKSFENVLHVLILKTGPGYEICKKYLSTLIPLSKDLDGSVFQELIDIIGPSISYSDYVCSEDFDSVPEYWANDLYRGKTISDFEHMSCDLCWGPNSPEVIANREIKGSDKE